MTNKLGQKIADMRHKYNLTQQEFADKIHYSRQHISKVEKGHTTPSRQFINDISRFFNYDFSKLLDIYGEFSSKLNYDEYMQLKSYTSSLDLPAIAEYVDKLRNYSDFQSGEPLQMIIFSDSLLLTYVEKDFNGSIKLCTRGLEVFYKDCMEEKLHSEHLTETSYSLLILLATNHEFSGNLKLSMELSVKTHKNIKEHIFNNSLSVDKHSPFMKKAFIITLNNTANGHFNFHNYNKSLELVNEGIEKSNQYNILVTIPYLLHLKFENLYMLEKYKEAKEAYNDFISICKVTERYDLIINSEKTVKIKYVKIV